MNPKLSIIVPVYKVEPYLKKCIQSILSQTFKDFELILVDDGSPDKCGEICDQYTELDSRVNVIHKKNGGLSSARNEGIKSAKGEYIGFIDSDDYIHEKMFEILIEIAMLHSSDMVVCNFLKVDENQMVNLQEPKTTGSIKHYSNLDALYQLFSKEKDSYLTNAGNNAKWVVSWNKLYKKELFEGIAYEEGRICEDEIIIHGILFKCKKVTTVSSQLYYYLQRPNSIISSSYSIKRFDKVYALKDRVDFFINIEEHKLQSLAYKSYLETLFWNYYLAKHELSNIKGDLKQLKRTLNNSLPLLIKNPLINWKQKIAVIGFMISPSIYELFLFRGTRNIEKKI